MNRRSNNLLRAGLAILGTYGVLGGATSTGLLTPQYRLLSLVLLTFVVLIWLFGRRRWDWHASPLDIPILVWLIAFAISLVANLDVLPRMLIGLWFAGMLIGLWYLMYDAVTHKAIRAEHIVECLLIMGLVAMFFGYLQYVELRTVGFRPQGTLDNPNVLAAFLIMLIPFTAIQVLNARRLLMKILAGIYTLSAAFLLILTDSRGAWIGLVAGFGVMGLMLLANARMLSPSAIRVWWSNQQFRLRALILGSVVVGLAICLVGGVYLVRSLSVSGRGIELRTYIFSAALTVFEKQPLSGDGLFAFGRDLLQYDSTPPDTIHSSAHNIILTVVAENGIPGLAALGLTLFMIWRAISAKWRSERDRVLLIAATAALVGTFVHHMVDFPARLTPLISIAGVMILVLLMPLPDPSVSRGRVPGKFLPIGFILIGLWAVILIGGLRNYLLYNDYVTALRTQNTEELGTLIVIDPAMPLYSLYQGYLLGLESGHEAAAIDSYKRFLAAEPYYAPAWANLATLYHATNQRDLAFEAMSKAYQLARDSWEINYNYAKYAEEMNNPDALDAYQKALKLNPDLSLYPEWGQTPLQKGIKPPPLSTDGQVAQLITTGSIDSAQKLAQQKGDTGPLISGILALKAGNRALAVSDFKALGTAPSAQMYLGAAWLAHFDGDESKANSELSAAQDQLTGEYFDERIAAISYVQYWMVGLPQYYLPGVFDPAVDAPTMLLVNAGFKSP